MTDAPERIWAVPERNRTVYMSGNSPITAQNGPFTHHRYGAASEYVRADLVEQAQRAVCDATVLIAHALDDRQIDDDVVERFDRLLDDLNAAAAALRNTEAGHE